MNCPNCGAVCDPASSPRFCNKCGAPLRFPAAPQPNRSAPLTNQSAPQANQNTPLSNQSAPLADQTAPQAAAAPAFASADQKAAHQKKGGKWMLIACIAAGAAIIAAVILIISAVSQKSGPGVADGSAEQSRAVNPMQLVSGVKALLDTRSCDFDLLADNGSVHVTGTVVRAEDLLDSCAIMQLPDSDGKASYAYLHEGRLMLTRGDDYITGLNIKGLSELLESKGGSTLDTVLRFFSIETTDLTYDDCLVLLGAVRDAMKTLQSDLDQKERLNDLFSIAMEAAIPLLKLRDSGELAETVKTSATQLLEAFVRGGISEEALVLSGTELSGLTAMELRLTPAVFFKEFVAFCKESPDFASICENLQTTPADVLAPYTDEALQSAFGDRQAILTVALDGDVITTVRVDYGEDQVLTLTLSNPNTAAVDEASYEFIEEMRSDPNVENKYIDNVFDFMKQLF